MHAAMRGFALTLALLIHVGCKLVDEQPKGSAPLLPPAASPEQITLEVFSAPVPVGDPQLASLWSQIDEQPFPPELRKKLAQNGLRAGVTTAHVPDALAALLKVTGSPIPAEQRSLVPLETEPGVVLRVLQPRPGKRHELVVSPVHDSVSLLRSTDGHVEGRTYSKAEGRLVLRVIPEAVGRARVELTPELQHGEPKTQTTGSEGMFIWKPQREKEVFAELKLEATLGAGEMLLITCTNDRPTSVGHHFFMQPDAETPTQRLWVLRLAQAGPDRSFADWLTQETGESTSDEALEQ